jgi:glycosyltransferase involved in cell wall biosynthesis
MNIAIYWEQYSWGGVDSYLKNLIGHWPDKSDKITFFSNEYNEGLERIQDDLKKYPGLTIKKIQVQSQAQFAAKYKRFGIAARILGFLLFPFFLMQNFLLLNKVITNDFDLIVSQNGSYPGGWSCLIVLLIGKLKKIPKNILVIHHSSTPKRKFWYPLEFLVDRLVVSSADKIIAVSKASLKSFINERRLVLRKDQGQVVYNGIELPTVSFNKKLFAHDGIKLGLLGRCEQRKGHLDLINAIGFLDQSIRKNFHAYFVGHCEDSFQRVIETLSKELGIKEQIHITGYLPESSAEIISNLDLLCCLTRDYEGFGLTVIEAMAVRTPVLSTNVGALKEFLEDYKNCHIVPPSSPHKIAELLENFALNRDDWIKLTEEGWKTANKFSVDSMVHNYREHFKGKSL